MKDVQTLIEDKYYINKILNTNVSKLEKVFIAIDNTYDEYLICTDKRVLIVQRKIFKQKVFEVTYDEIINVNFVNGFLDKYLKVITKDNNDDNIYDGRIRFSFDRIQNFETAKNFIIDKIGKKSNKGKSNKESVMNAPKLIREFKELYDDGIITKEEYEKKKKELMNL